MSRAAASPLPVSVEALDEVASLLRVLAHRHRLAIVQLLLDRRRSVGELAEILDLAPAAVSQHLNHMRAHDILDVEREGRSAYYTVISPHAKQLLACIRKHAPK